MDESSAEEETRDMLTPEGLRVLRRRYKEARRAGMDRTQARAFACDLTIDVGRLRHLVHDGCPGELLASILL